MNTHKITYIFIGTFVVVVVVGMVILTLITPKSSPNPSTAPASSTNPTEGTVGTEKITPKLPKITLTNAEKTRLVARLPYIGEGFTVEYYSLAGKFYVRMSTPGVHTAEYTAAVAWLQNNGVVDPQNTLDIQFTFPVIRR